jgi:hypothetical protein
MGNTYSRVFVTGHGQVSKDPPELDTARQKLALFSTREGEEEPPGLIHLIDLAHRGGRFFANKILYICCCCCSFGAPQQVGERKCALKVEGRETKKGLGKGERENFFLF